MIDIVREWIRRFRGGSAAADGVLAVDGDVGWHTKRFFMHSHAGRDQVARVAGASGWKAFERPTPYYFSRAVEMAGDGLVVDVGANTGFYTLLALSVSPSITVAAYEPMASVRQILLANLKLNKTGSRVKVSGDAVSDADGQGTLHIPDDRHGLIETSASLAGDFKTKKLGTETVSITRLDTVHVGRPRVAVLKIDAESHDLAVLRGAEEMIVRDRPIIFVEVLLGADENGLTDLLNRCGYKDMVLFPDGASDRRSRVVHETLAWNHMWVPEEAVLF